MNLSPVKLLHLTKKLEVFFNNEVEEWISSDKIVEITAAKQKKEWKRNEDSLRDFWDNIKGVIFTLYPEGEEREPEKISEEILAENFPKLGKQMVTKV